jgi:hypothetical protein
VFKLFSSNKLPLALTIYFGFFAVFIAFSSVIIYIFTPAFAYAQIDSVKFFLSSLIQSEATVIAIVITLSLVVIQLTASTYSTRVIDIFKESPIIWITVGTYVSAITYGLTILKFIDLIAANGISNFETSIWIAYLLAIFAFGALILYLINALDIMKSSTVINSFAKRITSENILSGVSENEKIVDNDSTSLNYSYIYSDILKPVIEIDADPIQPIIDIIHSSMMKYDYGTMRYGLKVLENYVVDILKNNEFSKDEGIITKHILNHIERVGKLAASRDDEDSVEEVVTVIFMIGKSAVEHEIENLAGEAVNSIKNIGRSAIKREMEDVEMIITDLIAEIGRNSAKRKLDFVTSVSVNSLGIIGKDSSKHALQGLEETVWMAGSIQEIGKLAIKYGLNQSVFYAVNSIGDMGKYTARNDLPKTTIRIINYLKELGLTTLEENLNEITNNAVNYLGEIGRIAVWSELNSTVLPKLLNQVNESLQIIRDKAMEKKFTETISIIDSTLLRIKELKEEQNIQ